MKVTKLSQVFPSIKERIQILAEISASQELSAIFKSWPKERQEEFLDICTGSKGVKMFYDSYFKEILSPEYNSERLSDFLSTLLGQKVKVKMALPNDTTRLGDELSLVITDIVVELEDGTLANIEVQKLGYYFTGERASCYSADLLLRQYKRIRDEKKEKFRYKDINPVYTIVLMENSPEEFHKFNDLYVHTFETISDTGLELKMLQNFIFIPVDIFLEKLHNKGIGNKLDAWLTFLGCDEPEYIVDLITAYPKFKPMYANLYDLCLNVERMMGMFSKELEILDRNTVKFMIDDMQEQAEKKIAEAEKQAEKKIAEAEKKIAEAEKQAAEAEKQAAEVEKQAAEVEKQAAEVEKQAAEVEKRLEEVNKKAQEANNIIAEKDKTITELLKKLSKYENNSDSDK